MILASLIHGDECLDDIEAEFSNVNAGAVKSLTIN